MDEHGSLFPGSAIIITGSGFTTSANTAEIQAHDAGFDTTQFLAHVDEVRTAILAACRDHDAGGLHRFVAPALFPAIAAQVAGTGPQVVDLSPTTSHTAIMAAHSDASFDTIVVRVSTTGSGPHSSDWTFQRSSQATTTPGAAPGTERCSQCGAPLKLDNNGNCVYCQTPYAGAAADWALVRIQDAPVAPAFTASFSTGTDFTPLVAAAGKTARVGLIVGLVVAAAGIVAAVIGVIAATSSTSRHISSAIHQATNGFGAPGSPSAKAAAKSLSTNLTLTGAINLSPSDLSSDEFTLNKAGAGNCPPAGQPITTLTLNVTFDSGAKLQGEFDVGASGATAGPAVDLGNGGAATLHFVGPTQATADDQTWHMPLGQQGDATVTVKADGGGTLKWQNFGAVETDHNDTADLAGLVTWTCG